MDGSSSTHSFQVIKTDRSHSSPQLVTNVFPKAEAFEIEPNTSTDTTVRATADEKDLNPGPENPSGARTGFFTVRHVRAVAWAICAAAILAWWICTIVLRPPGYGWIAQTVIAWFALLLIASKFLSIKKWTPGSFVNNWDSSRQSWLRIPYLVRLAIGWLVVIGIFMALLFGFRSDVQSSLSTRAIPLLGVFTFQLIFCLISENRSKIPWPTVVLGLILQQIIAMFVLKTRAGFDIFHWIITVVVDFFNSGISAKIFLLDEDTVNKQWFVVNVTAAVLFFLATVEVLYHVGVMQWVLRKLGWVFFTLMNISGAEAVVAAASPIVGQGDAPCLVRPYMNLMTRSELHLVLTAGYSTVSGTFMIIYISLGIPAQNLITSAVMSVPAVIAVSKMRCPETEEPITMGGVVIDRGEQKSRPQNILHAFVKGATFGLYIVGQIVANTLVFLSLLSLVNSLLTWIGIGFGIHQLTLQLIFSYILYPLAFLIGIPRNELLPVSRLLATKLVANELLAYQELQALMQTDAALSARAYTITTYALCGFANLSSLAVTGVISALAPERARTVVGIAPSALFCGFLTTMQTAAIA
ncbi:hypothetical protein D9757_005265 [Collybiopsis confluens]|uniref:Uncharacterized protein n=1 Tax=Collybiopsis confluens TaxID=2823264 RepID=A0A8H5HVT7_9AGAR|nr:hypothetical protein D9757_005265 [Collybiopsis confluens]